MKLEGKGVEISTDYIAIAEAFFQKKCLPDEVVHHIDGNQSNSHPENLVIMKRSQHSRLHAGLMGALDKWGEHVQRPLCNTCLFCAVYDYFDVGHVSNISDDLPTFLVGIIICSESKPMPFPKEEQLELVRQFYKDAKQWKSANKHDCYEGKKKGVVKGR